MKFQMTSEVNWLKIEIDHVTPISSFNVSEDEKLGEAFKWINNQAF